MSVYQLSYDVKDSEKTDNNEFRKKIIRSIIAEFKPSFIHRPVASTILFNCNYDISIVKPKLEKWMNSDAFYILTEAKIDKENTVVMAWVLDSELENNFKSECEQLKKTE